MRPIISPVKPELPFYLQYPPYFFAMMALFSYFDLFTAWLIWTVLGLCLLLGAIRLLVKDNFSTRPAVAIATAAVLAAYPTWVGFRLGQSSLLAFPALVAFWFLLRSRKFGLAGTAGGLMFMKLQYGPIVLLTGIILGALRFFLPAIATLAALICIAGFTVGWDNVLRYPTALLLGDTSGRFSGVPVFQMQNFRGAFALSLGGETSATRLAAGLLMFATAFGITWLWVKWMPQVRSGDNAKFRTLASITVLAMLASSLHSFPQDYLFAAIPCIWLWKWTEDDHHFSKVVRTLILAFPILSWVFFLFQHLFLMVRIEPFLLWALALLTCVTVDEFRTST
jgi:hypothetical protein